MASRLLPLVKIATEDWEFDQIHALNHRTFAEEIPQHQPNGAGHLVDRFHEENTYVIALDGRRLIGMLAIRGHRPFSLDAKLPNLDQHLPAGRRVCELRLLAVERASRAGVLLPAILEHAWMHIQRCGFDLAVISAVTRQLKLYRHLGFEPFGPLVGTPPVLFQPMMITREKFAAKAPLVFRRPVRAHRSLKGHFLPGPVAVHRDVQHALQRPSRSHRSTEFEVEIESVKSRLRELTGASRIAVLLGSGTMANDVVAGQLARGRQPGVVLTNGEFGERLARHARRWRLDTSVIEKPWGTRFDAQEVAVYLARHPERRWLWCVHTETSTGVLNDIATLTAIAANAGVRMCVDAISSIGTVPLDIRHVLFASGASGKGLCAFPGLALVLHNHDVTPAPEDLPAVLDLGLYSRPGHVPFTHSSNLLHALHVALLRVSWPAHFADLSRTAAWLRDRLRRLGLHVVGANADPAPGIVTIALPAELDSIAVSNELGRRGYLVSAHSQYLVDRNWIQIGLMGQVSRKSLAGVSQALAALVVAEGPATIRPNTGVVRRQVESAQVGFES